MVPRDGRAKRPEPPRDPPWVARGPRSGGRRASGTPSASAPHFHGIWPARRQKTHRLPTALIRRYGHPPSDPPHSLARRFECRSMTMIRPSAASIESKPNMGNRLFVGNLGFDTTDEMLRSAFSEMGEVTDSKVIVDRDSGRSRGFGFVTMATSEQAQQAISQMDGRILDGRQVRVNEALERQPRSDGGVGFTGGGGGGRKSGGGSRRGNRDDRW